MRDPTVRKLIEAKGWMLTPIIPYGNRTVAWDLPQPAPSPPDRQHWLGTDDQARDVLARLIYGFRISVLFGLALTIFSTIIGVTAGAVQGYFGGWLDLLFQRFIEIWSGLPVLYLLIILASIVEPNFWWLLGIMLLFSWMSLVGVVRAEFLRARNFDYVRAARALGVSNATIMYRHMLPNAMVATITFLPFILSGSITTLTALDFIGFGLPPGSASLGELLAQGKANLQAPWLGLHRVLHHRVHAEPADLRRRGGARRIRPAEEGAGVRGGSGRMVVRARKLRREATFAERRLWSRLRNEQLGGWQFRRQHPVPPYILDFACVLAMLAVEVDGGQHAESTRDASRDCYLQRRGWRVLRFWNHEVLTNTEGVIEGIYHQLRLSSPHPTLPRSAGEGSPRSREDLRRPGTRSSISGTPPLQQVPPLPLAGEGRGGG